MQIFFFFPPISNTCHGAGYRVGNKVVAFCYWHMVWGTEWGEEMQLIRARDPGAILLRRR